MCQVHTFSSRFNCSGFLLCFTSLRPIEKIVALKITSSKSRIIFSVYPLTMPIIVKQFSKSFHTITVSSSRYVLVNCAPCDLQNIWTPFNEPTVEKGSFQRTKQIKTCWIFNTLYSKDLKKYSPHHNRLFYVWISAHHLLQSNIWNAMTFLLYFFFFGIFGYVFRFVVLQILNAQI